MGLSFEFSPVWWVLVFAIYAPFLFLSLKRKSFRRPSEVKAQIYVGFSSFVLALFIELVAVSTNLWNYTPINWPVILWPCYFGSGLLGYQLTKSFEEYLK